MRLLAIVFSSVLVLGGCASGTSHVQGLAKQFYPMDVVAVVAVGVLAYQYAGRAWEAETTPAGGDRYRVVLKRNFMAAGGDGEARFLFAQHAERVTAQGCRGYRILEYHERLDTVLFGAQRVAEGVIECVRV